MAKCGTCLSYYDVTVDAKSIERHSRAQRVARSGRIDRVRVARFQQLLQGSDCRLAWRAAWGNAVFHVARLFDGASQCGRSRQLARRPRPLSGSRTIHSWLNLGFMQSSLDGNCIPNWLESARTLQPCYCSCGMLPFWLVETSVYHALGTFYAVCSEGPHASHRLKGGILSFFPNVPIYG